MIGVDFTKTRQPPHLVEKCNLSQSNFRGMQRLPYSFERSILDGADFSRSQGRGVQFTRASAVGANFAGAKLTGANFTGADLRGCNFRGASLVNARFTRAEDQPTCAAASSVDPSP